MAGAAGLAVTLIPVLMGYWIRGRIPAESRNPLNRWLIAAYRPLLDAVLRLPKTTLVIAALVFASTYWPLARRRGAARAAQAMIVAVILAGLLPIVWGGGTGSEVMSRIASPMLGGMVTAPLLSMFVIPAAYKLMRRREVAEKSAQRGRARLHAVHTAHAGE